MQVAAISTSNRCVRLRTERILSLSEGAAAVCARKGGLETVARSPADAVSENTRVDRAWGRSSWQCLRRKMPPARCGHGANPAIDHIFHDCVYNVRDYVGFVCGLASIITWMIAQFPQLISNFKNQSAEALSVWFLAEWLLGDTCNLIGCLLTGDQLVTQTYTAMYFICTDIALVMQYIYYGTLLRRRQRLLRNQHRMRRLANRSSEEDAALADRYPLISQLGQTPKPRVFACVAVLIVCGGALRLNTPMELPELPELPLQASGRVFGRQLLLDASSPLMAHHEWRKYVGQAIGWVSSFFYLGSRVAQIYKTWSRQSADGLSLAMFSCAITANVLYGVGILTRSYAWEDLVNSAPWLLGSLGTVFLDAIIFSQFSRYRDRGLPEQAPLLEDEEASN